jgi:quinol monooxygenase YgiN
MAQAGMFGVCGRLTALPGRREEVAGLIGEGARAWGEASGLVAYSVIVALEEPDTIVLTEAWTGKAAHDTWIGSEPGRMVAQQITALLAAPPAVWSGDLLFARVRGTAVRPGAAQEMLANPAPSADSASETASE